MKFNKKNLQKALASDDSALFLELFNSVESVESDLHFFIKLNESFKSYSGRVLIKIFNTPALRENIFRHENSFRTKINAMDLAFIVLERLDVISDDELAAIRKAIFDEALIDDDAFLNLFCTASDVWSVFSSERGFRRLVTPELREKIFEYLCHPGVFWHLFEKEYDLSTFMDKLQKPPLEKYASQVLELMLADPKKLKQLTKNSLLYVRQLFISGCIPGEYFTEERCKHAYSVLFSHYIKNVSDLSLFERQDLARQKDNHQDKMLKYMLDKTKIFSRLIENVDDLSKFCVYSERLEKGKRASQNHASLAIDLVLKNPEKLKDLLKSRRDKEKFAKLLSKYGPQAEHKDDALIAKAVEYAQEPKSTQSIHRLFQAKPQQDGHEGQTTEPTTAPSQLGYT